MTDGHTEFDELKDAMTAATPAPDPERRAANLALARDAMAVAFAQEAQRQNDKLDASLRRGWLGGAASALATITALALVVMIPDFSGPPSPQDAVLPDGPLIVVEEMVPPPATPQPAARAAAADVAEAPEAELQAGDSFVIATEGTATEAGPPPAVAASPEALSIAPEMAAPEVADAAANFVLPQGLYMVPWTEDSLLVVSASGDSRLILRDGRLPATRITALADAPGPVRFAIAAAGFELLQAGTLTAADWGYADALTLAVQALSGSPDAAQAAIIARMAQAAASPEN